MVRGYNGRENFLKQLHFQEDNAEEKCIANEGQFFDYLQLSILDSKSVIDVNISQFVSKSVWPFVRQSKHKSVIWSVTRPTVRSLGGLVKSDCSSSNFATVATVRLYTVI